MYKKKSFTNEFPQSNSNNPFNYIYLVLMVHSQKSKHFKSGKQTNTEINYTGGGTTTEIGNNWF